MISGNGYDRVAVEVIEATIAAETITAGIVRVRPETDEAVALRIVDALTAAGFEIRRASPSSD